MPEAIPPKPAPRVRPKLIRTNLYCPSCEREGQKIRMRRVCGLNGGTMNLTERRCICPVCEKSYTRTMNPLTKVSTFEAIAEPDPVPNVIFSRERKAVLLEAEREKALLERRD